MAPSGDRPPRWAVGIDVGGTFTDAFAVDAIDGSTRVAKVPSTPEAPGRGLIDALRALADAGVELVAIDRLVHGTTVATNALLTGRLARVALLATAGFRDVLGIRTGMRDDAYDLFAERPADLVPRRDRLEVRERIAADGRVIEPLTEREVQRAVAAVRRRSPEAVAVCLLFGYLDPGHEQRLAEALRRGLPGLPVIAASEVSREFREYPRTVTTVVAAGLRPLIEGYLGVADDRLRDLGVRAPLLVLESGGGVVPEQVAAREPHRLLLSGPAAGVGGAIALAERLGMRDLLTLDMGGTSADVCLVRDGRPPMTPVQSHPGAPLLVPAVDIATVGAGGGSIARLDAAHALLVGPESAAAVPGPAAYGRGGREPTVTDAHVVVGTLGEATRLAGRLPLDAGRARTAVDRVARPLGLDTGAAAEGILAIATAHLVAAIRRVSVERGVDPRQLPLVAYGGAGPLHAGRLLREMRLREVVVPPAPGLLSASGLVGADPRFDDSQTVLARLDATDPRDLVAWFRAASSGLSSRLAKLGIPRSRQRVVATADCRYLGQGYELTVAVPALTVTGVRGLPRRFHDAHDVAYGHHAPSDPVEAVTLRVSVLGLLDRPTVTPIARGAPGGSPDPAASARARKVLLPGDRSATRTAVWRRDGLRAGDRFGGPAIIEQLDATTLVLAGQSATVGRWGELRLREGP